MEDATRAQRIRKPTSEIADYCPPSSRFRLAPRCIVTLINHAEINETKRKKKDRRTPRENIVFLVTQCERKASSPLQYLCSINSSVSICRRKSHLLQHHRKFIFHPRQNRFIVTNPSTIVELSPECANLPCSEQTPSEPANKSIKRCHNTSETAPRTNQKILKRREGPVNENLFNDALRATVTSTFEKSTR